MVQNCRCLVTAQMQPYKLQFSGKQFLTAGKRKLYCVVEREAKPVYWLNRGTLSHKLNMSARSVHEPFQLIKALALYHCIRETHTGFKLVEYMKSETKDSHMKMGDRICECSRP